MPLLSEIARTIAVDLPADTHDRAITRIGGLDDVGADGLSYVSSDRYFPQFIASAAGVVLVPMKLQDVPPSPAVVLRVPDAELAIAKILALFAPPTPRPAAGVHPSAIIAAGVTIGVDAAVGPNVSIGEGAAIGRNVTLHANVVIGPASVVGDDTEIYPNVVLRERVQVGRRVIIHANSTIGTDGFGYRWDGRSHVKVPQIGIVVIEDDVEIGSNTCIDRAKFGETRVGRGTKIDNLVQVGHNCRIGQHCILCGGVALAGSTTLGNGVVMGGGSAAADHMTLADGVKLAARGAVAGATKPGQILAGAPAVPHRDWLKERVNVSKLPELFKTLKRLEAEIAALKSAK